MDFRVLAGTPWSEGRGEEEGVAGGGRVRSEEAWMQRAAWSIGDGQ